MTPPGASARRRLPLGKRSAVLLLIAIGYIGYGYGIIVAPREVPTFAESALLHYAASREVRGALWIAAGLVAAAAVVISRTTSHSDGAGYVAAWLAPAATAVSFVIGWATHVLPGGNDGSPSGLASSTVWWVIAGWALIDSGRQDDPAPPATGDAA